MNKIEFYSNLAKFQGRNGDAFLKHYGIIGQKWGQRRWQNADDTFNEAGKERYFGKIGSSNKTDKMLEKAKKKADKINDKIEKAVQSRLKHPLIYNTKGVNEDELRKFFTAYYNTPFYKRDAKGIEKTFNNLYDSEINSKMINNIKDAENARWMQQQAVEQHQEFVNQVNLQNHLNIHNQMVMNHMNFMGKPNKKQKEEQKELNKEIKELTNSVETSFNIPDKFKEYRKEIADQVCEQIAYMIRTNPDGELPKKIDVNISDDGRLKIDFAYDDNDQKIGSINNKTDKLLNSEEYKDLARNVGVDFLDPNDLASDDIKKDYKAVKHNMNPFIVAIDDIAHDNEQSAINYLNRFVKDKKEREILTKLCKKYGEQEKITIKENNENTKKLIKSIEHNKNLKENNISNEEYEKILNDTKSNNDLKKENARNVADIGLYKLNQMGNGGGDPGDNSSRAWFMYEDQTIGLPELTYLYYQGYSKNYIKQYVKNVSNKLNNMSYDEQDEYYEKHPGVWGISYANDYEYADDWIDTLFKN